MPRRTSFAYRLTASTACLAVLTACSNHAGHGPAKHSASAVSTPVSIPAASGVIPAESPASTGTAGPSQASRSQRSGGNSPARIPGMSPAPVPPPARATRSPIAVARAWTIAANSSSYLDPSPGSWTLRSAPLVTGQERSAELVQRHGGGGSTWVQITTARCVTGIHDLRAGIPADAPTGPNRHVVYVTGQTVLTCATGQIRLSPFIAQLTVTRVHGRWLVNRVEH